MRERKVMMMMMMMMMMMTIGQMIFTIHSHVCIVSFTKVGIIVSLPLKLVT